MKLVMVGCCFVVLSKVLSVFGLGCVLGFRRRS